MKNLKKFGLAVVALLVLGCVHVNAQNTSSLISVGKPASDFTINSVAGKPISLKDYRGKYLLIDFWASWCPDCRALNPTMVALYNKYKGKNIEFLGVSFDTDKIVLDKYLSTSGITWTQVSEFKKWKETTISKKYGIKWIPTIYIIDEKGKVVFTSLDEKGIDEKLSELLQ